jgi:hypothetical protein
MPLSANSDQPKETIRRDPDERHFYRFSLKTGESRGGQAVALLAQTRRATLVAYPIKNAVSERELRRVDEDIRRCRELVSKNLQQEAEAKLVRMRPTRAIRTDNKAGP